MSTGLLLLIKQFFIYFISEYEVIVLDLPNSVELT